MIKSFAKVKQQLADQLRPGKTEVLSEELQAADKRVEYIREALNTLAKALPLTNNGSNGEKKLKKGPDFVIYNLLKNDKLFSLNEDFVGGELLKPVLIKYLDLFSNLTEEYVNYEQDLEKTVSAPLHKLLENDIGKLKKNLSKHISDRDAASNKLQTAQNRHSDHFNRSVIINHESSQTNKITSLQDDVEDASQRVEQASDLLAHEVFTLLAKEPEVANYLLLHIKLKRQYYENVLDIVNKLIPQIEHLINTSEVRPVFNCPLADHLRVTKRKVALPIELCVCAITEHGIAEEGLFRVAAGASKLRRLKLSIDANCLSLPLPPEYKDVHLFAGVLKSYLRELPEPLLTYQLYDDWMRCGNARMFANEYDRIEHIKRVLTKLPEENLNNLRYLIKFLTQLSENSENKMSSYNIAIVMSPNLLWGQSNTELDDLGHTSQVVEILVKHSSIFFPGETEIYLTYKKGEIFGQVNEFVDNKCKNYNNQDKSNDLGAHVIKNKLICSDSASKTNRSNHIRNGSYETNQILFETGQEMSASFCNSPRPITRRHKNKPAPEPPKPNLMQIPIKVTSTTPSKPEAATLITSPIATVVTSTVFPKPQQVLTSPIEHLEKNDFKKIDVESKKEEIKLKEETNDHGDLKKIENENKELENVMVENTNLSKFSQGKKIGHETILNDSSQPLKTCSSKNDEVPTNESQNLICKNSFGVLHKLNGAEVLKNCDNTSNVENQIDQLMNKIEPNLEMNNSQIVNKAKQNFKDLELAINKNLEEKKSIDHKVVDDLNQNDKKVDDEILKNNIEETNEKKPPLSNVAKIAKSFNNRIIKTEPSVLNHRYENVVLVKNQFEPIDQKSDCVEQQKLLEQHTKIELETKDQPSQANVTNHAYAKSLTASKLTINKPKPVAAPRVSLLASDVKKTIRIDDVDVDLRNKFVEQKPSIPERPASLRPSSFRSTKKLDENFNSESITDGMVKSCYENIALIGHDAQLSEKEKFLANSPSLSKRLTDDLNTKFNTISSGGIHNHHRIPLQRRQSLGNGNKPERPPKPDSYSLMKSGDHLNESTPENLNVSKQENSNVSRHSRTMSDGNIVEDFAPQRTKLLTSSQTSLSGKNKFGAGLPPRPTPPPPPPPNIIRKLNESTNL